MALISESIKDVVSINLKHRDDDYSDQFSRIFMVKILIMSSLVTSMEFFNDRMSCILPRDSAIDPGFAHSVCWIQGFYIYTELFHRLKESGSYGMPKDIEIDGIKENGYFCRRISKQTHELDPSCRPLTKMYFTQYQYMPFYIASLAVLYYVPYILFRIANNDMIELNTEISSATADQEALSVANSYFNYSNNGGVLGLRVRVFATALIKFIYVIVNFGGFIFTDKLLNYRYTRYGIEWIAWSNLNNTIAYDYTGLRAYPKPGNYLLPSLGFCDITEGSTDVRSVFTNQYRIICEISPHILYQYVLVVLWFAFVTSILISLYGLLYYIISIISITTNVVVSSGKKKVELYEGCQRLTIREIQYMKVIRRKNNSLYKDIVNLVHGGTIV